jgi:DNA-binding MarR family transcriptional regulator
LLAALDQKEVLTMSAIAQKMGHTTAAASGLVDRLENLGYVVRSSAREDRRKVMVCITEKGSALVRRIREEMVGNLMKVMTHLTPAEQKAWLQIYSKIYNFCQAKEEPEPIAVRRKSRGVLLTSRRFENGTR